jgi:hypothetical protein
MAVRLVDKILKGESPGEIPVEVNNKIELVINLKVAKALAINIAPEALYKANRVIRWVATHTTHGARKVDQSVSARLYAVNLKRWKSILWGLGVLARWILGFDEDKLAQSMPWPTSKGRQERQGKVYGKWSRLTQ